MYCPLKGNNMDNYEASALLKEIASIWLKTETMEPREESIWLKKLSFLDQKRASDAIDELYTKYPPRAKRLPAYQNFIECYYNTQTSQQTQKGGWCPCCDGSSFIVMPDAAKVNYAHRCPECNTGKPTDDLCENLHCQNPSHAKTLEFPAGFFEKYQWQEAGYKRCCFKPALTEKKKIKYDAGELVEKVVDSVPF